LRLTQAANARRRTHQQPATKTKISSRTHHRARQTQTGERCHGRAVGCAGPGVCNRPISVHHLGEMPIQSCGQSVSARRGKRCTGIGLFGTSAGAARRVRRTASSRVSLQDLSLQHDNNTRVSQMLAATEMCLVKTSMNRLVRLWYNVDWFVYGTIQYRPESSYAAPTR
jgi:hypothetical protein